MARIKPAKPTATAKAEKKDDAQATRKTRRIALNENESRQTKGIQGNHNESRQTKGLQSNHSATLNRR